MFRVPHLSNRPPTPSLPYETHNYYNVSACNVPSLLIFIKSIRSSLRLRSCSSIFHVTPCSRTISYVPLDGRRKEDAKKRKVDEMYEIRWVR